MSHAPTDTLSQRHRIVRQAFDSRSIDALVITALPNILYLTNFTGSAAIAVITADRLHFITDFRYVTSIEATRGTSYDIPGLELVVVEGSYDAALASLLRTMPSMRVGFESAHMTVAKHEWLMAALARDDAKPALVAT